MASEKETNYPPEPVQNNPGEIERGVPKKHTAFIGIIGFLTRPFYKENISIICKFIEFVRHLTETVYV